MSENNTDVNILWSIFSHRFRLFTSGLQTIFTKDTLPQEAVTSLQMGCIQVPRDVSNKMLLVHDLHHVFWIFVSNIMLLIFLSDKWWAFHIAEEILYSKFRTGWHYYFDAQVERFATTVALFTSFLTSMSYSFCFANFFIILSLFVSFFSNLSSCSQLNGYSMNCQNFAV